MSEQERAACKWQEGEYAFESDDWKTTCGQWFQFFDGTPADNGFVYCPFCGKEIEAVESEDEEEDEERGHCD